MKNKKNIYLQIPLLPTVKNYGSRWKKYSDFLLFFLYKNMCMFWSNYNQIFVNLRKLFMQIFLLPRTRKFGTETIAPAEIGIQLDLFYCKNICILWLKIMTFCGDTHLFLLATTKIFGTENMDKDKNVFGEKKIVCVCVFLFVFFCKDSCIHVLVQTPP